MGTVAGRRQGHRIDSDYPEDLVGLALESFLAFLSFPFSRYSLEPFSRSRERWLGADARLHSHIAGFRPVYMQFKRPTAYAAASAAKIVRERKALKLSIEPHALFFGLRDKAPAHHDYQHNVLKKLGERLRKRGLGDAAYVCPLFLDRGAYRWNLYLAGLGRWIRFWDREPFHHADLVVDSTSGHVNLDRVPLFAEHVSIRAHEKVAHARHSYSFSEAGRDICFHSPTSLPEAGKPLSRWLSGVWNAFADAQDEARVGSENAIQVLRQITEAQEDDLAIDTPPAVFETRDGFEAWHRFGNFVKDEYGIDQYAIVAWK